MPWVDLAAPRLLCASPTGHLSPSIPQGTRSMQEVSTGTGGKLRKKFPRAKGLNSKFQSEFLKVFESTPGKLTRFFIFLSF
jgi:hypothetical protein